MRRRAATNDDCKVNRRLSIEADGGAKDHPSGFTRETSYSEGALAIADGEGVMSESPIVRTFVFFEQTDLVFHSSSLASCPHET